MEDRGASAGVQDHRPRLGGRSGLRRSRRAVSDVIATILILAITVVLFASLFAFVTNFSQAPAQSSDQFQASLQRTANQTYVSGVTIVHLSGPLVSPTAQIYLSSTRPSSNWQFRGGTGIPVAWGIGNGSGGWNLGQSWVTTFPHLIKVPENVTVYIVFQGLLLFSVNLPGPALNTPPVITQAGTVPTSPAVGAAFQIFVVISGNLSGVVANISLAGIPGLPATSQSLVPYNGEWVYNVSAGRTTNNGTYYGFVSGTNPASQTFGGTVPILLTGSGIGGNLAASVSITPYPAFLRCNETLIATISNAGATAATISSVKFWANNSTTGTNYATLTGTVGAPVIAAHSSETVYSSAAWLPWVSSMSLTASLQVNLTTLTTFSSGTQALGYATITILPAYSATVVAVPSTVGHSQVSTVIVNVTNAGPFGGSAVNVSVSASAGTLASTWTTPSSNSPLGGSTTLGLTVKWTSPSSGAATATITITVKISNPAWAGLTPAILTFTLTAHIVY